MSARYGSRTRSGEAVSDLGRRGGGGGASGGTFYEEVFTAPGTWTWPGVTTSVEVTVVGGGGGGQHGGSTLPLHYGGAGGYVTTKIVTVSAPVPVTVGAGGNAGATPGPGSYPFPGAAGSPGGISGFGPLGPGPIPTIPATTVAAGGGQGGGSPNPAPPIPSTDRLILGGSAVVSRPSPQNYMNIYGYDAGAQTTVSPSTTVFASGAGSPNFYNHAGLGRYGFGGGGGIGTGGLNYLVVLGSAGAGGGRGAFWDQTNPTPGSIPTVVGVDAEPGKANTGGGGGGGGGPLIIPPYPPGYNVGHPSFAGGNGGSGVVIVRWVE